MSFIKVLPDHPRLYGEWQEYILQQQQLVVLGFILCWNLCIPSKQDENELYDTIRIIKVSFIVLNTQISIFITCHLMTSCTNPVFGGFVLTFCRIR